MCLIIKLTCIFLKMSYSMRINTNNNMTLRMRYNIIPMWMLISALGTILYIVYILTGPRWPCLSAAVQGLLLLQLGEEEPGNNATYYTMHLIKLTIITSIIKIFCMHQSRKIFIFLILRCTITGWSSWYGAHRTGNTYCTILCNFQRKGIFSDFGNNQIQALIAASYWCCFRHTAPRLNTDCTCRWEIE